MRMYTRFVPSVGIAVAGSAMVIAPVVSRSSVRSVSPTGSIEYSVTGGLVPTEKEPDRETGQLLPSNKHRCSVGKSLSPLVKVDCFNRICVGV